MIRFASVLLILIVFLSCKPKEGIAGLELTSSPVISHTQRVALVIDPYIALRDKPGDNGITIAHARRGEVYITEGKRIVETAGSRVLWIDLGKGWVRESAVQFYSSEARAHAAGRDLKDAPGEEKSDTGVVW